jgi:AraC-like DNA-binding protein
MNQSSWQDTPDRMFRQTFTWTVLQSLTRTHGNISQTSRELGVSRQYIHRILKRYREQSKTEILSACPGRPQLSLKHLTREQFWEIHEIMTEHTAASQGVPFRWQGQGRQHYKGWYSRSVIELVTMKYGAVIGYGTANLILHRVFDRR